MRTRLFLPLLFLLSACTCVRAQFCDGNLGENIFTDGDFGSGTANIPATDPLLAPGFIYQRNPPPSDGFYTITNNTGAWPNRYDTWLAIRDNSPDPNGYMMVVNANFTPGIFYLETVDGLCENTTYQFTADIINMVRRGTGDLRPNVSFFIGDTEFYTTGLIPEDETWTTYGFTFITEPGQNSVTLSLRNNAPGGIGNDLAIDNIAFRPCGPEAMVTPGSSTVLCEDGEPLALLRTVIGDQYPTPFVRWQTSPDGVNDWTDIPGATDSVFTHTDLSAGTYYYRYLLANNSSNLSNSRCRVTSNTETVTVLPKENSVRDTICDGDRLIQGDNIYFTSGIYVDSFISSIGCDSIVTLNLTVSPNPGLVVPVTLTDPTCSDTRNGTVRLGLPGTGTPPYVLTFNGQPYTPDTLVTGLRAGDYEYAVTDASGCRTEDTLSLVGPPPFDIFLSGDQRVLQGDNARLLVRGSEDIVRLDWFPEDPIRCDTPCLSANFLPDFSTTITARAFNEAGCVAVDSVAVTVIEDRSVYLPNAFSPNGDGINDFFFVQGASDRNIRAVLSLRVYNRWGAEVFARFGNYPPNLPEEGWDGLLNGEPAPVGTYLYVAEVRFIDNKETRLTGSVTLLR